MQWNACSLHARSNELNQFLSDVQRRPDIICINETFLKPNSNFYLLNYDVVRKDRIDRSRGGVATLIRTGLSYKQLQVPDSIEGITVEVKCKNMTIIIVNVYLPPSLDIAEADLRYLFSFRNAVIVGDMNAHSTLWGSTHTTARGNQLESIIDDFKYCVLNTGIGI